MYPLPFPSFPNLLGNSFSFLFFHSTSPNSITWVHLSVLCKSERLRLNPFEYLVQLVSGGADRKDEFFHFNVPPFCTQSRGIKATFLHGALIYFRPLHNAALAVKCMNKEREWLSLSLTLSLLCATERRGMYLRSWTLAEETREDHFVILTTWEVGLFEAEDCPNLLHICHWQGKKIKN